MQRQGPQNFVGEFAEVKAGGVPAKGSAILIITAVAAGEN
jgi:hypothetical protein